MSKMWRAHGLVRTTQSRSVATPIASRSCYPAIMNRSFSTRIHRACQSLCGACAGATPLPTCPLRNLPRRLHKSLQFCSEFDLDLTASSSIDNHSDHSKPITPACQTGFLQVAVSNTLRRIGQNMRPDNVSPERFRYSTRTSVPLARDLVPPPRVTLVTLISRVGEWC